MAMGVPVAKITNPLYRGYVDYDYAVVNSTSINELANRISYVIENKALEKYSQNAMDYVRRRTWNSVKFNLYNILKY